MNKSREHKYVKRAKLYTLKGFPGGAGGKEPACQRRRRKRHGFDPWVGKIPGGGHGSPLQYSCLENPMDRGDLGGWIWSSPRGCKELDMTQATEHTCTYKAQYCCIWLMHPYLLGLCRWEAGFSQSSSWSNYPTILRERICLLWFYWPGTGAHIPSMFTTPNNRDSFSLSKFMCHLSSIWINL